MINIPHIRMKTFAYAAIATTIPTVGFIVSLKGFFLFAWLVPILVGYFLVLVLLANVLSFAFSYVFLGFTFGDFYEASKGRKSPKVLTWGFVGLALAIPAVFLGFEIRKTYLHHCICEPANNLIAILNTYLDNNNRFPSRLNAIPEIVTFAKRTGIEVAQGAVYKEEGIDVSGINDADVTIYIFKRDYFIIVPIEWRSPGMFTSNYAWTIKTNSNAWQYEKIRSYPRSYGKR
jgi:4-amino-4-deoxy-L-arabinose transferase-like glycosyltransferase